MQHFVKIPEMEFDAAISQADVSYRNTGFILDHKGKRSSSKYSEFLVLGCVYRLVVHKSGKREFLKLESSYEA